MASAARVHIAERGRDPRRYVLLATGGAGPIHAWYLATRLGIERVVCPPSAGVASALGLLLAPDRVATVAEPLARPDWDRFEATYRRIEEECRSVLAHAGLAPETARIVRSADLRFRGRTSRSSSSCPRDRTLGLPREPSRMRSGWPTNGLSPGCRPESGPRGGNVRVAARAGGEGRRTETTGADIRAARGERDARRGTRLAFFPEYRRPMRMPVGTGRGEEAGALARHFRRLPFTSSKTTAAAYPNSRHTSPTTNAR